MKEVYDSSGTQIKPGERVVWTATNSKNGKPRKGVLVSVTTSSDWSGKDRLVAEFVVLVGTYYWRSKQTRYRICRRRHILTGDNRVNQVLRADYALTAEETEAIRKKVVRLSAAPLWGLAI